MKAQRRHCGNNIHAHHFTCVKSLTWLMILIWNFPFFAGMNKKINPGDFKTKPSDFTQNCLCMEKFLITTITHGVTHGHVHWLWLLGRGRGGGNASTRSKEQTMAKKKFSGCQCGESSAQCFHNYDNISNYPLLLGALTHTHFSGVGGDKRACSEMEIAGGGYHMKQTPGAGKTCDRINIICSVDSNPKSMVACWGVIWEKDTY